MSNYQLGIYERARAAERKEEKRNAKKKLKQRNQQGIYADTTSTYRIFSRAFCNFVFPNELVKDSTGREHLLIRPMPKTENSLELVRDILKKVGVAITPGLDFDPKRGKITMRLSYACSTPDLQEGIGRLRQYFSEGL